MSKKQAELQDAILNLVANS